MLSQGATAEEIVEGYLSLDKKEGRTRPVLWFKRSLAAAVRWPGLGQKQSQFGHPVIAIHFRADIEILDR
jgi:hypothetical protein